jgi:putative transposase
MFFFLVGIKEIMELTQKLPIFPKNAQEEILWTLSEKCRLIYNFALAERKENWKQNKEKAKEERKFTTYVDQQNQLPHLKEKYPEYRWVYSKVLQMTLKKLDADYKSFRALRNNGDEKARPPGFKSKNHFTTLCYNQSGFKIRDSTITFSHGHPSKVELTFHVPNERVPRQKIKQVELFLDSRKRWFISITYEVITPEHVDNGLYQALDLGVSQTAGVNLHGKTVSFKHRRADLYWKKKIEEVQGKRDHCKKRSRKWNWYHQKLAQMKRKQANQLKYFQHWLSKQVVENTKANTIVMGDLKVKKMARKKKGTGNARKTKAQKTLNHSVHNTGFMSRFAEFLTYKAEKAGKRVIRIGEEKTTKACCTCGELSRRALHERIITCNCGNHLDRDLNSSFNIMVKFLEMKKAGVFDFLLHQPSMTEESFLLNNEWNGFLRHTGLLDLTMEAYS